MIRLAFLDGELRERNGIAVGKVFVFRVRQVAGEQRIAHLHVVAYPRDREIDELLVRVVQRVVHRIDVNRADLTRDRRDKRVLAPRIRLIV